MTHEVLALDQSLFAYLPRICCSFDEYDDDYDDQWDEDGGGRWAANDGGGDEVAAALAYNKKLKAKDKMNTATKKIEAARLRE